MGTVVSTPDHPNYEEKTPVSPRIHPKRFAFPAFFSGDGFLNGRPSMKSQFTPSAVSGLDRFAPRRP
jgi:hypothetical protein